MALVHRIHDRSDLEERVRDRQVDRNEPDFSCTSLVQVLEHGFFRINQAIKFLDGVLITKVLDFLELFAVQLLSDSQLQVEDLLLSFGQLAKQDGGGAVLIH